MKQVVGVILFMMGIFLAIYFGFYCCFIGSIMDIVGQINHLIAHQPLDGLVIGLAVLKFICTGVVFWVTFLICAAISSYFLKG